MRVVKHTPAGGSKDPRPVAFFRASFRLNTPRSSTLARTTVFQAVGGGSSPPRGATGRASRLGACSVSKTDGCKPAGFDSSPDPLMEVWPTLGRHLSLKQGDVGSIPTASTGSMRPWCSSNIPPSHGGAAGAIPAGCSE